MCHSVIFPVKVAALSNFVQISVDVAGCEVHVGSVSGYAALLSPSLSAGLQLVLHIRAQHE